MNARFTLPPRTVQARSVSAAELADHRQRHTAPWAARHLSRRYGVPLSIAYAVCEAAGFSLEGRQ
jgi:hypothetical protein